MKDCGVVKGSGNCTVKGRIYAKERKIRECICGELTKSGKKSYYQIANIKR